MVNMRVVVCVVAALLLVPGALGQIAGLEVSYPGVLPAPGPDPEGWLSSGMNTVVPFGQLPAPVSGFPTEQVQWLIIDAFSTGFLPPPAAGVPPVLPLLTGASAWVRFPVTVPQAGGLQIAFDWNYVTRECPNDPVYNDFLTVDFTDATGARVLNLVYRDTFSNTLAGPAQTPDATFIVPWPALCWPTAVTREEVPIGAPKTTTVAIPASLQGQSLWFEVNVGNATDISFASYAYLDNVRWIGGPPAPLRIQLGQPFGSGSFRVVDTGLAIGVQTLNLFSLEPAPGGVGTGPYLGLWTATPANLIAQATVPIGTLPFSFVATTATLVYGPLTNAPVGLQVEAVAVEIIGNALGRVSPVAALTTQ